jgi:hypothetical protein
MNQKISDQRKVNLNVRVSESLKKRLRDQAVQFEVTLEELVSAVLDEYIRSGKSIKKTLLVVSKEDLVTG